MQGRGSGKIRDFALFGETTGETDEFGLPIRYNWALRVSRARDGRVRAHTRSRARVARRPINIDTGCVFGGRLTALRYPEKEIVSVPAERTWCQPVKPILEQGFQAPALTAQQEQDDVLDMEDVLGKRIVTTRLHHTVTVREENAIAALEVMSRFAANPKWLIYLPPTMSPSEHAERRATRASGAGVRLLPTRGHTQKVICEEKHVGSRAVIIVCRDTGVAQGGSASSRTRTASRAHARGHRFFDDLGQGW